MLVCAAGVASFSVMDALMKQLSIMAGAYNALLWRSCFGAVLSALVLARSPSRRVPPWPVVRLHVFRASLNIVMAWLFFWSLVRLPLAEAIALSFIAPIVALYLSALLLHEKIRRSAVIAALLGFVGVLVILSTKADAGPHRPDMWAGVAALFGSALLFAYNLILQRQQALLAPPAEIAFSQNLLFLLLLLPLAPWLAHTPPAAALAPVTVAATLATTSLLCMGWAYARTEAQRLIPIEYTGFLWAALMGWLIFAEPVTGATIVGAMLILAGCTLIARDSGTKADS
jgi:S-adenosylmethionine uptake transporter